MSDEFPQPYVDAAIAAVSDTSRSPEEAANAIVEQCTKAVRNSPAKDRTEADGDTPGLELFLWTFWAAFFELAKDDGAVHERLLQVLAVLKGKGSEGCGAWVVWGSPVSWEKLPLFGPMSRDEMNGTWYQYLLYECSCTHSY